MINPRLTWHVFLRNLTVYRKTWLVSLSFNFVEPLLYLSALGIGLGAYVQPINGVPYLNYLAPGLVASSAVFATSYECTYGSFIRMEFQKTYYAIISTPANVEDVIAGDILFMESLDAGKSIAAAYLRDNGYDLEDEISRHPENQRDFVQEGIAQTFLQNIRLPLDETDREFSKRALEGFLVIKKDKRSMGGLLSQMEYLFQYYAQSYEQSYQNFKDAFSAKLSNTQKALERRTGQKVKIDPEKHPAFREEWLKAVSQLNAQYEKILAETKEKLINVP